MSVTLDSSVFMGKNYLDNCHSITNTEGLTLKQMFDISARLVSEQDEISGVETIGWENNSWKYLSLIGDERVINLQRKKVYAFSDSVLCLGKIHENPQSNDAWEDRLGWFNSSPEYRNFDRIDGEPMDFEWTIFQIVHKVNGTKMAERMLLEFAESGCPICRATSPLARGQLKSKGHGKLLMRYCADLETIQTVFRTNTSVNQLSLYGAVAEKCEEYESFHDRTGQPVVGGQSSSSFVPSVIKTEVPLDCDDLARKDLLLQQHGERIEKLSQQDKSSTICAKMITAMRGADLIVFRNNWGGKIRNLMWFKNFSN